MKNPESPESVDLLIRLAFLEGKVRTHGAYEEAAKNRRVSHTVSESSRLALLERLEGALNAVNEVPLTIGGFLRSQRSSALLKPDDLFKRLGITRNIYRMLEQDRLSPLKIAPAVWARLRTLFQLQGETLAGMIRRTHQLVFFRPAFRSTLARYDKKAKRSAKSRGLEQAATELYTRAHLDLPPEESEKLDELLNAIRKHT